jgi:hypothetical protein
MIPGIFQRVSQKLKCMDKLRIPIDTIDIIKSFVFYNIHSHAYYKVISKTKGHINDKFTEIKYVKRLPDGHWFLGFMSYDGHPEGYLQLQAKNCVICGEYIYFKKWEYDIIPPCRCPLFPSF